MVAIVNNAELSSNRCGRLQMMANSSRISLAIRKLVLVLNGTHLNKDFCDICVSLTVFTCEFYASILYNSLHLVLYSPVDPIGHFVF